jgi:hypothetical protein
MKLFRKGTVKRNAQIALLNGLQLATSLAQVILTSDTKERTSRLTGMTLFNWIIIQG